MELKQLTLPAIHNQTIVHESEGLIYDVVRKKELVLTPEEWVRQHVVHLLYKHLNYPLSLMKLEGGLTYNKLAKRSDILIYDREGSPFLLVECKAPSVAVDQKVFEQAALYNKEIKAPYIFVTNGIKHFCASYDFENHQAKLIEELPVFK
ncbi:MAG: type I restriction enzyme HsdR N-terminal domain-containing protein [Cyclobacteriaceae bacterium]|nr:type I restriction enzyme HsdR N-terminal domain-containing protein [Cyclobacteriaceae bacterium]MCH8515991.1 type I restriction enzyme HsdR N-terminal domain-containing protein [Cyclobacteriaceae bacterium]